MTTQEIVNEFSKYFTFIGLSKVDGYPCFKVEGNMEYMEYVDFENLSGYVNLIKITNVRLPYLRHIKLKRILSEL